MRRFEVDKLKAANEVIAAERRRVEAIKQRRVE
jgi:hypothetical protein